MKLSVILPFYYKTYEFDIALGYNKQYLTADMELVIPIDEPDSEAEVKRILDKHSIKNYQIKVNPNKHEWRSPSKAINVGIRLAKGEYVLVMSPESICVTDVYGELLNALLSNENKKAVAIGNVVFYEGTLQTYDLETIFAQNRSYTYGSLCSSKQNFVDIGGYNEAFEKWGYDDEEIRIRFQNNGYTLYLIDNAKVIHNEPFHTRPKTADDDLKYNIKHSKNWTINNKEWGIDF